MGTPFLTFSTNLFRSSDFSASCNINYTLAMAMTGSNNERVQFVGNWNQGVTSNLIVAGSRRYTDTTYTQIASSFYTFNRFLYTNCNYGLIGSGGDANNAVTKIIFFM
jgi:hypothetical protein